MAQACRLRKYNHAIELGIGSLLVFVYGVLPDRIHFRCQLKALVVNDPVMGWLKGRHLNTV